MESKINDRDYLGIADNGFIDREKFIKYVRNFSSLEGWFEPGAVQIFETINHIQKSNKIHGNLFEIGAYHGKSTIMLGLMAEFNKESVSVCDIFDQQKKNVSGSGCGQGDKEQFLRNFNKYFSNLDRLHIYEKPSQQLTPKEIGNNFRFFYIDGGHLMEETFQDLCLAEKVISRKGIIAIDDYFNEFWPGVSGGVCKFLTEKPGRLVPLLIGHNKIVFCRPQEYNWYFKKLQKEKWVDYLSGLEFYTFLTRFWGSDTILIYERRKFTFMEKVFRFSWRLKFRSKPYRQLVSSVLKKTATQITFLV